MHEGALVEAVLSVVLEASGGDPVRRVRLRVGAGQGVIGDSWDFHWRLLAENTPAAAATLDLVPVAGDALVVEEVVLQSGEVIRNPDLEPVDAHEGADHVH